MAILAVSHLQQTIGLPCCLRDVGVQQEGFAQMAEDALGDAMMISNPRSATQQDIIELLERRTNTYRVIQ